MRVALIRNLGKEAKLIYDVRMENTYSSNRPQIVKIPSSNRDPLKPQKVSVPIESGTRELRNPFVIPGLQKVKIESQLNPNYNFINFVEGDSNRLARSAEWLLRINQVAPHLTPYSSMEELTGKPICTCHRCGYQGQIS